MINILLVVGARPNFIKIMPLIREFKKFRSRIRCTLVHTGQHYDKAMSGNFFKDLSISKPDIYLGVGSSTHGKQTAKVIEGIEDVLLRKRYDLLIVVGDVNSTIAAALAASKLGVKIVHIEAGLRSFDRNMPEEINRVLTDHISDYLFTTERSGNKNLEREGIPKEKIFFVGNIMIDSYKISKDKIKNSKVIDRLGLTKGDYSIATIHRPSNVDQRKNLKDIAKTLNEISKQIKVVFPVHPRTKKMLKRHNIVLKDIMTIDSLGYIDFQSLLKNARFVVTDSGGIQEESTIHNVPCLTLRDNTERPVTLNNGSNELVGTNRSKILGSVNRILSGNWKQAKQPSLWDGKAAKRITRVILNKEKFICQQ